MDFIKNFIDWITETVNSVITWFHSFIDSATQLFKYISYASDTATNLLDSLPPWLKIFGTVTIFISVLYMILGRSSGGVKN